MSKYLTLVYDVENLNQEEIKQMINNEKVRYMAWGHVPYERDDLKLAVNKNDRQEWNRLSEEKIGELYQAGWKNNTDFARAIENEVIKNNT